MNPPNYQLASKRFPGRCEDVVLSLHIQILYASIGTHTVRNGIFPRGRCENVVLSLHIQILYASIGTRTLRNSIFTREM
jgi:hypothetical protein